LRLDPERSRIALSRKRLLSNPWESIEERYRLNDTILVTITRVIDFGAFAQLEPGIEGLIHISELADITVAEPLKMVTSGDRIAVKILRIHPDRQRIGLSRRQSDETIGQALLESEAESFDRGAADEQQDAETDEQEASADSAVEPESTGEPEASAETKAEPAPLGEQEASAETTTEPVPTDEPEVSAETTTEPKSTADGEASAEAADGLEPSGAPEASAETAAVPESAGEPDTDSASDAPADGMAATGSATGEEAPDDSDEEN
jgi:predicted RNA-binding protein with RPS1 domain